ncbi:hypothetical protein [Selenomonas sp. FC4001]|uniref:hypothetical protein n=1 Tax=Selenomonas sp. FC4001 TaxID=1408313 RepID=UPI001E61F931|nr:hypothetical protein [Selenomonas sp. FC4001]
MKKLIALLLASVMMIVAAGCGGGEQAKDNGKSGGGDKKITMGFSQIGAESEWRTANTESIKKAAEEAGINLQFSSRMLSRNRKIRLKLFVPLSLRALTLSPSFLS